MGTWWGVTMEARKEKCTVHKSPRVRSDKINPWYITYNGRISMWLWNFVDIWKSLEHVLETHHLNHHTRGGCHPCLDIVVIIFLCTIVAGFEFVFTVQLIATTQEQQPFYTCKEKDKKRQKRMQRSVIDTRWIHVCCYTAVVAMIPTA